MSLTGLSVVDESLHLTHAWLKEICAVSGLESHEAAFRALRVTLHALRDRLGVDEAAHLSAQLPMVVRGVYFEGWRPARTPTGERTLAGFLAPLAAAFDQHDGFDAERTARAVCQVLAGRVSAGEIEDVRRALPAAIRVLFDGEFS